MSVLKNNRGTSELEFYHTAIKLRKEITQNLLRDFGVKNRDAVTLYRNIHTGWFSGSGMK